MGRSSSELPFRRHVGFAAFALAGVCSVAPAAAQAPPAPTPSAQTPLATERPREELVRSVESLSARRVPTMPGVVRVVAVGTARIAGSSRAKLLPFEAKGPPPDGMYEFAFTVIPDGNGAPEQPTTVNVAFDWFGVPENAVGIRVRAGANVLETRIVMADDPAFDPKSLVGRRLVMNGIALRGDVTPDLLPAAVAIVRAGEPGPKDRHPERLVIVIDADGIITDAYFG